MIKRGACFFPFFSLLFMIADKERSRREDLKRCLVVVDQGDEEGKERNFYFLFLFHFQKRTREPLSGALGGRVWKR
jgi:hypothetical protein